MAVTALIRTYNSDQTLADCLHSLKAQSLSPGRLVVVDSGSTDDTLSIARRHEAEIVHYPDGQPFNYSLALNIGMEQVQTSYALIISSHVMLPASETVETMKRLLTETERRCAASIRGMVSSPSAVEEDVLEWELVTSDNFVSKYGAIGISNSCNLIPRRLWASHPFDEDIPRCEDQKWLQHYLDRGRVAVRILRPQIIYDNPYYNDRKEIRDLITLAKYDINPTLTSYESFKHRFLHALAAVKRFDGQDFLYNVRLLTGLLWVRLGLYRDAESKYF